MSNVMPTTGTPSLTLPCDEQPTSEWASSTFSALDPSNNRDSSSDDKHPPKPSQSTVSTPGFVAMPGGLPLSKQGLVEKDVQYDALDVLETAEQAAQSAAHSAQIAMQTAGEKVRDYLPASITSYLRTFKLLAQS